MSSEISRALWRNANGQAVSTHLARDPEWARLNRGELEQVMAALPPLEGRRVLELGAGTGRYTRELLRAGAHVLAIDISPEALEQNARALAPDVCARAQFRCADLTEGVPVEPGESFDLAFVSWLLMYLDDAHGRRVVHDIRDCLRPGGHLYLRESCRQPLRAPSISRFRRAFEMFRFWLPKKKGNVFHMWTMVGSLRERVWWAVRFAKTQIYREAHTYESWLESDFEVVTKDYVRVYEEEFGNDQQWYWLAAKRERAGPG